MREINEKMVQKTVEDLMEGVRAKTLDKNKQRKDSDDILKEIKYNKETIQKPAKKPEDLIEEAREKTKEENKEKKDSDEFLGELKGK